MVTTFVPYQDTALNPKAKRRIPPLRQARAQASVLCLPHEERMKPYPDGNVPPITVSLHHLRYKKFLIWSSWDQEIVNVVIADAATLSLVTLNHSAGIALEIPERYGEEYDECK